MDLLLAAAARRTRTMTRMIAVVVQWMLDGYYRRTLIREVSWLLISLVILITHCDLCPPSYDSFLKNKKTKKIWDAHKNQKIIKGEEPILTE